MYILHFWCIFIDKTRQITIFRKTISMHKEVVSKKKVWKNQNFFYIYYKDIADFFVILHPETQTKGFESIHKQ